MPDVNSSRVNKGIFLLVLLVLSLSWKAAVQLLGPRDTGAIQIDQKVAAFLTREHFRVTIAEKSEEGEPAVLAVSGECRIRVVRSRAEGFQTDQIRRLATADETVFAVFGGRIYSKQPTWLTVAESLFSKVGREFGFRMVRTPILQVIASPSCDAERLPWADLK